MTRKEYAMARHKFKRKCINCGKRNIRVWADKNWNEKIAVCDECHKQLHSSKNHGKCPECNQDLSDNHLKTIHPRTRKWKKECIYCENTIVIESAKKPRQLYICEQCANIWNFTNTNEDKEFKLEVIE